MKLQTVSQVATKIYGPEKSASGRSSVLYWVHKLSFGEKMGNTILLNPREVKYIEKKLRPGKQG